MRKPFSYRGCEATLDRLPQAILVGCNFVNRYLREVWRVTFPDGTWARCGTKDQVVRYVNSCIHQHG